MTLGLVLEARNLTQGIVFLVVQQIAFAFDECAYRLHIVNCLGLISKYTVIK